MHITATLGSTRGWLQVLQLITKTTIEIRDAPCQIPTNWILFQWVPRDLTSPRYLYLSAGRCSCSCWDWRILFYDPVILAVGLLTLLLQTCAAVLYSQRSYVIDGVPTLQIQQPGLTSPSLGKIPMPVQQAPGLMPPSPGVPMQAQKAPTYTSEPFATAGLTFVNPSSSGIMGPGVPSSRGLF